MNERTSLLVVDDNQELALLIATMLPADDYDVVTAPDGAQGLAMIRERAFDIVLMDVEMPVKSGLEALVDMQKDPALAGVRVVMMTAQIFDPSFPVFLQQYPNVKGFIGKPFTGPALANILSKALSDAVMITSAASGPRFKTILIADDDAAFLQSVVQSRASEVQTTTAQNGAAAYESLRKSIPELVVLDAFMPRYTGVELLRAMSQDPARSKIPAVILTDFKLAPRDAGMLMAEFPNLKLVLEKPVAPDAFWAEIEKLAR